MDKGKSIKTSINIHHNEEFITKKNFNEFTDKIYRAIGLEVQNLEDGLSKQSTTQALGEKLLIQYQKPLVPSKQLNLTTTKSKAQFACSKRWKIPLPIVDPVVGGDESITNNQ